MSYQKRQAIANFARYVRSDYDSLFKAYEKPSKDKRKAWEHCKNLCDAFDGYRLKVITKNCHMFTAGFQYIDVDSGEERFYFITKSYEVVVAPC